MKELLSKSIKFLNSNLKEIIIFSIIINIASFGSSFFLPVCGIVLSTMISFYMQQVFIESITTETFDRDNLPEPNYKGILTSYGFNLILSIPSIIAGMLCISVIFVGSLKTSILYLSEWNFEGMVISMLAGLLLPIILLSIFIMFIFLIFPFASFVFLDKDFSDNGFFNNIKLSFKLAKGYRGKIFVAMLINYLLTFLSIFTLGLSLIYTYPLYIILICNIYNDGKNKFLMYNI